MENKTILIVDDTKENLDILSTLLVDYDVVAATNGKDALDIVDDEKIDLILLDVMMPDMDGYEVCSRLQNDDTKKEIPILFITALTSEDSIERAYDIGGVDYITKPFKPKELLSKIKTQLKLQDLKRKEIEYIKHVALDELIGNIAHQWRQPLSVISTIASGISFKQSIGKLDESTIIESCDTIVEKSEYLSAIIDSMKIFINNTKENTTFSIKFLIDNNYKLFFGDIDSIHYNINISINIEENLNITSNYADLVQVLLSIITNAKDILNERDIENKLIFINAKEIDNHIVINIYDNAMGISEEIKNKIFEPYFTTKHQSQGKGLGLYSAKNIMKNSLNGKIDAQDIKFQYQDTIYQGANFRIKLLK